MSNEKNLQYADLHIHSHYSRATSKSMNIRELALNAKIKGLTIIGTGDFTHPKWLKELKATLNKEDDIYDYQGTKFIPTAEISLIYSQDGKGRRVHHVILAPDFSVVDQINEWLLTKGRTDYDGRPIFGFSSIELVEQLMSISKDIEIISAHCLTPWFGLLGSMSGFDSVEECFQEKAKHIHALETGLSADPSMIHRVDAWSKYNLVSFSDSHSPFPNRLGRECCVFDIKPSYHNIIDAIRTRKDFESTIEFFPEEGKYHIDGHRACNVSMEPKQALKHNNICPVCNKQLTIGVLHRVEQLADRPEGYVPKNAVLFKSLIPLMELIAAVEKTSVASKKVKEIYNILISRFGSEFNIMLNTPIADIRKVMKDRIAFAIAKNRSGKIKFQPGYDGVYGKPLLDSEEDSKESSLGDFV